MRKDFVSGVGRALGIGRESMIEKDLVLHQLLLDLSKNEFFRENFVFKGGTCLIKSYLGYFRFSEDVDFTWKRQEVFRGMSQKAIRRSLSKKIYKLGEILERLALKRGLDFRCNKNDRKYVEFGGGNKFLTFKIWFRSEVTNMDSFVKVQVNFLERLLFRPRKTRLNSLLQNKKSAELKALFPELYREYSTKIPFFVYDIREIVCEKVRSILTRRGVKARDFIDAFMAWKKLGIKVEELEDQIVEKTRFMLGLYARFRQNLNAKSALLAAGDFSWGDEKNLVLEEINEREFYLFVGKFTGFLKDIAEKTTGK